MNIWLDSAISRLQVNGGISTLWRNLTPELRTALPEATWSADRKPDLFISTYYARAPLGVPSLVLVYDAIQFKYGALAADPVRADIRCAIEDASAVVAISQETADDVARFFGREATVAYCGGSERFRRASMKAQVAFQQKYNINKPYVLMVGRRGLYKNAKSLYQAWPYWSAGSQHLVVCIGGEPPSSDEMDFSRRYPDTWRQLQLSDADLDAAYSGCTSLVIPSLYEGFGLPILEAMSCGCPVVCGANGALGEVGGDAAFTCEPLLPRSLAAALSVTCQPEARLQHTLAGYAQSRRFTWSKMAAVIADEIRKVA